MHTTLGQPLQDSDGDCEDDSKNGLPPNESDSDEDDELEEQDNPSQKQVTQVVAQATPSVSQTPESSPTYHHLPEIYSPSNGNCEDDSENGLTPNESESDEDIDELEEQDNPSGKQVAQVMAQATTSVGQTPESSPTYHLPENHSPSNGINSKDVQNRPSNDNNKLSQESSSQISKGLIIGGVAAVTGVGAIIAAPVVLAAAGFGAAGVIGGSLAAVWQSSIGSIVAGSLFASLQSAGAAGLAASTLAAVGATGGAAGAAVTTAVTTILDKNGPTDKHCSGSDPEKKDGEGHIAKPNQTPGAVAEKIREPGPRQEPGPGEEPGPGQEQKQGTSLDAEHTHGARPKKGHPRAQSKKKSDTKVVSKSRPGHGPVAFPHSVSTPENDDEEYGIATGGTSVAKH